MSRVVATTAFRYGKVPSVILLIYANLSKPDSLLNTAWMAARRRAEYDPGFYANLLAQLPPNFELRSTL